MPGFAASRALRCLLASVLLWHFLPVGLKSRALFTSVPGSERHGGAGSWPCRVRRLSGPSKDATLWLHQRRGRLPARQGAWPVEEMADHSLPAASDTLNSELVAFADATLPRHEHKKAKQLMMRRLLDIARVALRPEAEIYCFGSSSNGFGEASSDVDVVLYVSRNAGPCAEGPEAMFKVVERAHSSGFAVLEARMTARVPIVTLELLDDNGNATGYTCDVSLQRTLPLHNTRLLRTYAELMPELPALVVVVKRWAKKEGLAKTWEHYISSYSWTLLVVYYMQVCHGLPSLHELWRIRHGVAEREEGEEVTPECPYDVSFVGHAIAKRMVSMPNRKHELSKLLQGFFEFYGGGDYDWDREVVSVRLGARKHVDSPAFNKRLQNTIMRKGKVRRVVRGFPHLNIEDPIEVYRNLNFALKPTTVNAIKEAVQGAAESLRNGTRLSGLLGMQKLPQAQRQRARRSNKAWVNGYLALGKRPPCECSLCGMNFTDYSLALEHESSRACNK